MNWFPIASTNDADMLGNAKQWRYTDKHPKMKLAQLLILCDRWWWLQSITWELRSGQKQRQWVATRRRAKSPPQRMHPGLHFSLRWLARCKTQNAQCEPFVQTALQILYHTLGNANSFKRHRFMKVHQDQRLLNDLFLCTRCLRPFFPRWRSQSLWNWLSQPRPRWWWCRPRRFFYWNPRRATGRCCSDPWWWHATYFLPVRSDDAGTLGREPPGWSGTQVQASCHLPPPEWCPGVALQDPVAFQQLNLQPRYPTLMEAIYPFLTSDLAC